MSEENKSNLEKIKDAAIGVGGAAAIGGGIATGNPFLVLTGATAVFGSILSPTLNARREKWFSELQKGFDELKNKVKGFDPEKSLQNDEVVTVVLQATQIAMRTHNEEKLQILRNAVLNTALKIDIIEDEKSMFFNIVDDLTPIDIAVLRTFYDPQKAIKELVENGCRINAEKNSNDEQVTIPDDFAKYLRIDPNFYKIILNNLETRGLLQNTKGSSGSGLPLKDIENITKNLISYTNERTTSFGGRFLQFISEPHPP